MNILIVDDNANNRMLLRLLIEDYNEEGQGTYSIDESPSGEEAVTAASEKKYDLILMDIMMPGMDGIEATKLIRAEDKDVMIIAVSGVEDEARQKAILRNGAEDYISKPINAKQLYARLDNYFTLISKRHLSKRSKNLQAVNLYTEDIFHRQIIFYIDNDEGLSEFWEYYLLNDTGLKVDHLSDVVRAVFSLGDAVIRHIEGFRIVVEEDDEALYFTIDHCEVIDDELFEGIIQKNKEAKEFTRKENKISFKLEKSISIEEEVTAATEVVEPEPEVVIAHTDVTQYRVFNYMDPEDFEEAETILGDLSSLMLMLGNSLIESEEVDKIAYYLERMGRGLSIYTESYKIGQALLNLSEGIVDNKARFHEIASELSTLSSAFVADLQSWWNLTFYKGAPSIDFMDDTILANTQTIISMLRTDDTVAKEEDLYDIFDF